MAMIDYGAVYFKNGVCQNKGEFFMNMKQSVGWTDASAEGKYDGKIDGDYFVYAGDEHITVAIYKYACCVLLDKEIFVELWGTKIENYDDDKESCCFSVDNTDFSIHNIVESNRVYWLNFNYKGDRYDIVYGYGIDSDPETWDRIKVDYLGEKLSNEVDELYKTIRKSAK